jgi:hypothetical protein
MQVLSLTPAQIDALPPNDRATILHLVRFIKLFLWSSSYESGPNRTDNHLNLQKAELQRATMGSAA